MESVCSLCKKPAYVDEAGHEDDAFIHNIYSQQLTHKACDDAYNIACYDMHKPTLSRERGDIADDFGREQQLDAWADSQESSHPFD